MMVVAMVFFDVGNPLASSSSSVAFLIFECHHSIYGFLKADIAIPVMAARISFIRHVFHVERMVPHEPAFGVERYVVATSGLIDVTFAARGKICAVNEQQRGTLLPVSVTRHPQ